MAEDTLQNRGIVPLIYANVALVLAIVFGAGIAYQRLTSVESRIVSIEQRVSQLDAIAAIQAKLSSLEEEVKRARDRVDRAVDQRK